MIGLRDTTKKWVVSAFGAVMKKIAKASEESASAAKAPALLARPRRIAPLQPAMADGHARIDNSQDASTYKGTGGSPWTFAPAAERAPPIGGWSKRAFDLCASAGAIILLLPLLVLIAIAVRIDSPGPAIFRQDRGGFGGKTFKIFKFRTMKVQENTGVVQARHRDPRITSLGAFLRRSSWDELPQLFNVLMGDMSIIGPRPHALEHDEQFARIDADYSVRFLARPGVTGLAQVNGCRGPTETDDKVRARTAYDAEYVRKWTWWREFKIIAKTVVVLVWKRDPGAL